MEKKMLDPVFAGKMMKLHKAMRSTRNIERKDESDLLHGEDGDMMYKYDLPIINLPLEFKKDLIKLEGEDAELT